MQHNGVTMGAPLAPVIVDIFMAPPETTLIDEIESIGMCEWHRYIDGTFMLVDHNTKVDDVLSILNNFHPSIKVTHKK
jgi:hypothetical protein